MPQLQVAANPWHQEEEERDTNQHAQNKAHRLALSSPSEVIAKLKGLKKNNDNTQKKT